MMHGRLGVGKSFIFATFLIFAGCKFVSDKSNLKDQSFDSWPFIDNEICRVHYSDPETKAEAELYRDWLSGIAHRGEIFFEDQTLSEKIVGCKIYIHSSANDLVSPDQAVILTTPPDSTGNITNPTLHFLSIKQHGPENLTVVNEPKNAEYFHKTLAHEYITMFFDVVSKDAGWQNFDQMPNWFSQGLQEYAGLTTSGSHSRDVTFPLYKALAYANPNVINFNFGVVVGRGFDYVGGAIAIEFLIDVFEKEKLFKVLRHQDPDFGKALRDIYGTPDQIREKWTEWAAKNIRPVTTSIKLEHIMNAKDLRAAGVINTTGCCNWGFAVAKVDETRALTVLSDINQNPPTLKFGASEQKIGVGLGGNNQIIFTISLDADLPEGSKVRFVPSDNGVVGWEEQDLEVVY